MKPLSVPPVSRRLVAAAAGVVLLAGVLPVQASAATKPGGAADRIAAGAKPTGDRENYDSRDLIAAPPAAGAARPSATASTSAFAAVPSGAVRKLHESLGVQGIVAIDKATGTPRQVAKIGGFLTGPSSAKPATIALNYVKAHLDVFKMNAAALKSLSLRKDYVDVAKTHHLSFVQTVGGVPVFGNGLKAHVAKDGRLIGIDGSPLAAVPATPGTARMTAAAARAKAVTDVFGTSTAKVKTTAARQVTFTDGGNAKEVLFQTASGPRLAWQVLTMDQGFIHVVADDGTVLFRQSTIASDTGLAFPNYPGAPVGGTQVAFNLLPWLPNNSTRLAGNVAHVYSDVNDNDLAEATEEVKPYAKNSFKYPFTDFTAKAKETGCTAAYKCSWDPKVPNSWKVNRTKDSVQMYYFLGTFHDHLRAAPIGFTRAAGNFESADSDAVQGQSMDGANTANGLPDANHVDNANMNTPPDGTPPIMQMYLFHQPGDATDPFIAGNSGDSADIVYHEYTHGLSNRLVVGPDGVSTLGNVQAGSMGEAWSDWYAMDYLATKGLQKDTATIGDVLVGKYVTAGSTIRSEPLDCPVGTTAKICSGAPGAGPGGYTYGDFGRISGGPEVHADGEIWAQTLWDLRTAIGSKLTQSLVTRAMELSPANPSFLDERNSILQADKVVNGGKMQAKIWQVFARRGMGYFAASLDGDDAAPIEDFSMPPAANTPRGTLQGKVSDRDTGTAVGGVEVGFGGHASGFAGDYRTVSAKDGSYKITGIIPGTYPKVFGKGSGYDPQQQTVSIASRVQSLNWQLRRDWAALSGGSKVVSATGPDYTPYGCGPPQLLDQSQSSGWGSDVAAGGQNIVVQLPSAINISELSINPSGTCGDDETAGAGTYRVQTSPDGTTWTTGAEGQFPAGTTTATTVALAPGSTTGVKFIRYFMLTTQAQDAGLCPGGSGPFNGCVFLDSTELSVYGPATP